MYPAKMSLLPEELFKNLMASLEVGLSKYPFPLILPRYCYSKTDKILNFDWETCLFVPFLLYSSHSRLWDHYWRKSRSKMHNFLLDGRTCSLLHRRRFDGSSRALIVEERSRDNHEIARRRLSHKRLRDEPRPRLTCFSVFLDWWCSYGPDVTKMSLEALSSLATHCYLEIQKNVKVPIHEILQHFLKVLKCGGVDSKNNTVLMYLQFLESLYPRLYILAL